jgi:hypothetical protein
MSEPQSPDPVLLIVAAFSRHADALAWATRRLRADFGPILRASPEYDFDQTDYYEPTMGRGLRKCLLAFRDLIDPGGLADVKRRTNALEAELALSGAYPEPRPLNLDPGLLTLGKFMLATTKDQHHRVYLREGIFAEVTLRYTGGEFEPWPWTYADYRLPLVRSFLKEVREYYYRQVRPRHTPPHTEG